MVVAGSAPNHPQALIEYGMASPRGIMAGKGVQPRDDDGLHADPGCGAQQRVAEAQQMTTGID